MQDIHVTIIKTPSFSVGYNSEQIEPHF